MGIETVETFITRYGWVFERHDDVLLAGLETDGDPLLISFLYSPPWLRISMPSFAPGRDKPTSYYLQMLRLNHETRLVRFAIDEQGDIVLCVDIYGAPEFDYQQFEVGLDAITYIGAEALPRLLTDFQEEGE